MKLSILIPNYNYARFLSAAIEAALAVDWPDKEVIVCDDGSTDTSREVIVSFGSRVTPLFQANGGQNSAINTAFSRAAGDLIIISDSDDVLLPSAARSAANLWHERVTKVQYSGRFVDEDLRPLGACNPTYRAMMTPQQVRDRLRRTAYYPFLLAGVWNRRFLDQVFPLPVREGPAQPRSGNNGDWRVPFVDRYLSYLAPFFGDVVLMSDDNPQMLYRLHGSNGLAYRVKPLEEYASHIIEELTCVMWVNERLNAEGMAPLEVERHEVFERYRLICQRFDVPYPAREPLHILLFKYWRSILLDDAASASKTKWFAWSLLVAAAPRRLSKWAVGQREHREAAMLIGQPR